MEDGEAEGALFDQNKSEDKDDGMYQHQSAKSYEQELKKKNMMVLDLKDDLQTLSARNEVKFSFSR
jgi:hypothetical protein